MNYNLKKGVDMPSWQWLPFVQPGPSYPGASNTYDGKRYIYWVFQYGTTTAGSASTTTLWRYDTWDGGWQWMANLISGNQGIEVEYDALRNVLYIMHGTALTSWQIFNLNLSAVTILGVVCQPYAVATLAPVLPAASNLSASFTLPLDTDVPITVDTGTALATGNTTTVVAGTAGAGFWAGHVGLQLRVTSGAQAGQIRHVSAVGAPTATSGPLLTLSAALPSALAAGDTFVLELPGATATGGSTTTLVYTGAAWTVNMYANSDVMITAGTGAGQRRRIASNTVDTLTLAAATTGNPRTGPWTTAPDATSVFRIVPSSDFLYYQPGNASTALYRIDLLQTTAPAWSALLAAAPAGISGGGNLMYGRSEAPFFLMALRGGATANFYLYNIGTNTWSTPATYWGGETITTGTSSTVLTGRRKIFIIRDSSVRAFVFDLVTGVLEPAPILPFAVGVAYDGKRAKYVKTADGVEYIYTVRAGGQEHFRLPLEWL
ncbi:hypothetical protein [Deinococcus hopiensis]|uniref:hypothetical protein n=1 Tax=Deinococcus hopiensis TaxID=309885 RepID=UPI00111BE6D6|nr:hypothetical protein [Deinococcus hopiensis]